MRRWLVSVAAVAAVLALTGCGQQGGAAASAQDGLQVVATTSILGDVTRNVVGDTGQLEVLIEPGTDPHSFEPSAQQIAALREADLVVANGLQLVPALVDPLQAAEQNGANILRLAEQLDPVPYQGAGGHAGESREEHAEHAHGAMDPHVWFDPVRMSRGATLIGQRVAAVAPQRAGAVRANAEQYAGEIMAVHRRIEKILGTVPQSRRELVTSHDALGYFAQRYGFEVIGTVIPGGSTLSDPSSGGLAELVGAIRRSGAPAIFAETTAPTRLAETVSREVGTDIEVIELYTGSLAGQGKASTYLGMMTVDAQRVAAGLAADPAR